MSSRPDAQHCCRSGTPLQNDLHELHNLLLFLVPDVFKELPQLEDTGVRPALAYLTTLLCLP